MSVFESRRRRSGTIRHVVLVGAALAVVTGLAACGGENSGSDGNTAGTDYPDKVRIGRVDTLTYMNSYLADSLGYLDEVSEEFGTEIEVVGFTNSNDEIAALAGDQIDVAFLQEGQVILPNLEGQEFLIVAAIANTGAGALVVSNEIEEPADLAGKKIGVSGLSIGGVPLTKAALEANGVDPESVELVALGSQDAYAPALKAGRVSAVVPGEPVISSLLSQDLGKIMFNFYDKTLIEEILNAPYLTSNLATTGDFRDDYPDLVQAVVDAHIKALKWMHSKDDDPEAVLAELPEEFQSLGAVFPELYERILGSQSEDGVINPAAVQTAVDIQRDLGADVDGLDPASLYDPSFAENSSVN